MNLPTVNTLLAVLGSFWTRVFTSTALLKTLIRGQLQTHAQSNQKAKELVNSVGNKEIPAGTTTVWTKLVFSIYSQASVSYGLPDGKYGTSYFYGQLTSGLVSYDVDTNILSIPFMYNDPVNPTSVLTEGIDYKITSGKLVFRKPLSIDAVTTLYARNMVKESGFVTSRLGYAVNAYISDKIYQTVPFKTIWRMYSYGPNYSDLMQLIGACSKTPVTANTEVVELVSYLGSLTQIITDKQVYCIPSSKSIVFKVGQVLPQGTPISSGIQVLHDKFPNVNTAVPTVYKDNTIFKYGDRRAYSNALMIIKADILGEQASALSILKDTLPLDIKVVIFTNIDLPAVQLSSSNFVVQCTKGPSRLLPVPIDSSNLSFKTTAKLKYTSYGY